METSGPRRGPSPTKAIRSVDAALAEAKAAPGTKVLYSVGHTKYGGRSKANDIRSGLRGPWRKYFGLVSASAFQEEDGTYSVYIYVKPEALDAWSD